MKPTTRPGASLLRHLVGLLTLALALVPAGAERPVAARISPEAAVAAVREIQASAVLPATNRVSQMGPDGDGVYDASRPAIAYNSADNQYLSVDTVSHLMAATHNGDKS